MDVQILSIQAGVSKKVGNSFIVKGNALSKQVGLFMPKKKSEVERCKLINISWLWQSLIISYRTN